MQKATTLMWRIAACMPMKNLALCCRFPPLVLSTLGSRNIEFLLEYSEKYGIRYPRSALHIEHANFFLVHDLSSFRNSLAPLSLPGMRE
jgi:hypothetical protein